MEVFLFARLHAQPGSETAVRQAIETVLDPTRKEPGCLGIDAFCSVRDPLEFYIHSRWRDRAAFDHHAELPHTVRFTATVEPLLDHPLKASLTGKLA